MEKNKKQFKSFFNENVASDSQLVKLNQKVILLENRIRLLEKLVKDKKNEQK